MYLTFWISAGVKVLQVIVLITVLFVSSSAIQLDEACRALIQEVNGGNQRGDDTFLACETPSGMIYRVKNATSNELDLVKKNIGNEESEIVLQFDHTAQINMETQEIESDTPPKLIKRASSSLRKLAVVTGTKSILVVRIVASGVGPTVSELALSDSVFGNNADGDGADPVTATSQYAACSHGKIQFVEASNPDGNSGVNIRHGAVTISVTKSVQEQDYVIRNAVTTNVYSLFGAYPNALADHVMYCMPPGAMDGIAYAFVNSYLSVYNDLWCTYVSAQMHGTYIYLQTKCIIIYLYNMHLTCLVFAMAYLEIGHNLNLNHSWEGDVEYDDMSGVMGYSSAYSDAPLMCFNAAKSWQLGWYSSRHLIINLNDGYSGDLGSVVHDDSDPMPAIIKINNSVSPTDLYITFNWKYSFNSGTQEGGNQVMVVETGEEGAGYSRSDLLGKQSVGSRIYILGGQIVYVTVNSIDSINGYANVDICYGNCVPTAIPSRRPTPNPIAEPSQKPLRELSSKPTDVPSSKPINKPSMEPSLVPTRVPSTKPSIKPSPIPSPHPTLSPSATLSLDPSHLPSREISSIPSGKLSSSPTKTPSDQTVTTLNPTLGISLQPTVLLSVHPTVTPSSKTISLTTTVSVTNSSFLHKVPSALAVAAMIVCFIYM